MLVLSETLNPKPLNPTDPGSVTRVFYSGLLSASLNLGGGLRVMTIAFSVDLAPRA